MFPVPFMLLTDHLKNKPKDDSKAYINQVSIEKLLPRQEYLHGNLLNIICDRHTINCWKMRIHKNVQY